MYCSMMYRLYATNIIASSAAHDRSRLRKFHQKLLTPAGIWYTIRLHFPPEQCRQHLQQATPRSVEAPYTAACVVVDARRFEGEKYVQSACADGDHRLRRRQTDHPNSTGQRDW